MAYAANTLHLRPGAAGNLAYIHDAGSDTMATVLTAGYFNNTDDDLNLVAEDLIWSQCGDGNMWHRVSAVSSGSVTTQFAGGDLPIQTHSTGTAAALNTLSVGFYEVGTSIATATRNVLPTPYPGARVLVRKVDSGTEVFAFDAGGSGATTITYDSVGNRKITMRFEGEGFEVVGSSTSRWRLYNLYFNATGASSNPEEGGSVVLAGT